MLRRLLRKTREVGWLYAAQLALRRFVPRFLFDINVCLICAADVRRWIDDKPANPCLRWATPADLSRLNSFGLPSSVLRSRMRCGGHAVIFEVDGEVVGQHWYNVDHYDQEDWLSWVLPPASIYGYEAWVRRDHRGEGIVRQTTNYAVQYFARKGFTHSFGYVDALNRNSRRAFEKFGYSFVGSVFYIRILTFAVVRIGKQYRVGRWNERNRLAVPLAEFLSSGGSAEGEAAQVSK